MITNARRTGITSSIVRQALMRLINETDFIQRVPTPEPEADPTDIWLRDAETNEIEVLVLTAAGKREMQKMVSEGN